METGRAWQRASDPGGRGVKATRPRISLALLLFLIWSAGCVAEAEPAPQEPVAEVEQSEPVAGPDHPWPPRVGEPYPNLQLRNSHGERVALEAFRGKVILVEPIGMDCPACNAFAGGNQPGSQGFQGVRPQPGLPSVDEILRDYAGGASLADDRLVLVHLLLYEPGRQGPPSVQAARLWAEHFGLAESENTTVLVGEDNLIGPASYRMIPGFQLIDHEFVLRYDATGHRPRHDLWRELMPAIPALLAESGPAASQGG
jgi:hypothetical protein